MFGSIGGFGGVVGMIVGGMVVDWLVCGGEYWCVIVVVVGVVGGMVCYVVMFISMLLFVYYVIVFFM